jgi:hypothetical protein
VQIVHHGFRLDLEGLHQVSQRFAEEIQACKVFKVAQMLALVNETAAREGKDVLQMPADGQQRRRIEGQRHSERHKSAGAANQLRTRRPPTAITESSQRCKYLAVVHQEGVGDLFEPLA